MELDDERFEGFEHAAAISELSLYAPGTFAATASEEPSSRPQSARPQPGGGTGGGGVSFVAAPPPARPPSRVGAPAVRRKMDHAVVSSPRPGSRADDREDYGGNNGHHSHQHANGTGGRQRSEQHNVADTLGPRVVGAANEFADIMQGAGAAWAALHTLLHSATKERSELMVSVARQESLIAEMHQQAEQADIDNEENVRRLQDKADQEQQEALHAARLRFDSELQQKLQEQRQEEAKARADAVAEVSEQAEHDKATALAEAREAGEQELTQALAVARQRAEEEKLEALDALRQRANKELREVASLP
ncbi:hypothetical protein T484DRAFT_1747942 [Baffinella frigidus]|nr:hypothetical protein T484DRAFT_1747942 [Cryptophyta sp. CCMP2293]